VLEAGLPSWSDKFPNFIKIKTKAREAEVKQNLHSIQLAVERYAVDSGGAYPYFLYGGGPYYNIGTSKHDRDWLEVAANGKHPYDMFNEDFSSEGYYHTYPNRFQPGGAFRQGREAMADAQAEFGDTLIFEGYLNRYPNNPFTTKKAIITYGEDSANPSFQTIWVPWRGCGAWDGRSMFNLGWAGEGPSFMAYSDGAWYDPDMPKNEFPGQFYYHPKFSDGASNADHFTAQYNIVTSEGSGNYGQNHVTALGATVRTQDVWSNDVLGYDLLAIGDPSTDGMDIDWSISAGTAHRHGNRTGYINFTDERNPYNPPTLEPRTQQDGVADFYIIHLSSSQDAKPENVV
jgi:hypothetical protein